MSALKKRIEELAGLYIADGIKPSDWHEVNALQEISDRLDEDHKRLVDNSKRLDALEQQAHTHGSIEAILQPLNDTVVPKMKAQDERSCENCGNEGLMKCGCIHPNADSCPSWQPKAQDERSCDSCFHEEDCMDNGKRCRSGDKKLGAWVPKAQEQLCSACNGTKKLAVICNGVVTGETECPCCKAQEQGGDDGVLKRWGEIRFSLPADDPRMVVGELMAKHITDLRARLALLEKENAELRDWNKAAKESVAIASAEVSKLQAENAELKRSQCDLSKCKHIDDLEKECAVLKSGQCVSCGCLEKPNYKSEVKG